VLLGAVLIATLTAGVQTWRVNSLQTTHAQTVAAHAEQLQALERTARIAADEALAETARRISHIQEVANEAQTKLVKAQADATAAAVAGQRLRDRIATLIAAGRCPATNNSAAAIPSQAADATSNLLADVQLRLDEAADTIARFADEAHTAGLACERAYIGVMQDGHPSVQNSDQ